MAGKKTKLKRKSNGRATRSTKARKTVKTKARSKTAKTTTTTKKLPSVREPMTKTDILRTITDVTTVSKKDVVAVLECLNGVIEKHVKTGGPGKFVMPGMMKIQVTHKKATKARKGINPFTGEETVFKAKPARKVVKIKALKKLKEMVS